MRPHEERRRSAEFVEQRFANFCKHGELALACRPSFDDWRAWRLEPNGELRCLRWSISDFHKLHDRFSA